MTSEQIKQLRELLGKATPGEWKLSSQPGYGLFVVAPPAESWMSGETRVAEARIDADVDLIAAMHNALPALLDAAEENNRFRALFDKSRHEIQDAAGIDRGNGWATTAGELRALTAERARLKAKLERVEERADWIRSRAIALRSDGHMTDARELFDVEQELRAALEETP